MNGKFQLYVVFVDGIPIGIGTLTKISQFCNVKRRDVKKLVPQKWRHGGRPHKKPKAYIKKCGHVIEIIETRRFLGFSTEEMGRGKDGRISRKTS